MPDQVLGRSGDETGGAPALRAPITRCGQGNRSLRQMGRRALLLCPWDRGAVGGPGDEGGTGRQLKDLAGVIYFYLFLFQGWTPPPSATQGGQRLLEGAVYWSPQNAVLALALLPENTEGLSQVKLWEMLKNYSKAPLKHVAIIHAEFKERGQKPNSHLPAFQTASEQGSEAG